MKAILVKEFGDPEVMQLTEKTIPDPGPSQIVVKVEAIGVNPVDTYIRSGLYPLLPELPYTPGLDAAGIVSAVGEGVSHWKAGDRVYVSHSKYGTYAQYTLCEENRVYRLPEESSYAQGAAMGVPGAAAWRALFQRGKAQPGERVLVHGASGAVGLSAVQLAVATNMEVYGTASNKSARQKVLESGAIQVFNHRDKNYLSTLQSVTENKGFDLILEMAAHVNLEKDLELLSNRGRVIIIGNRGRIEIDPRMTMGKETDIRGLSLFNANEEEMKEIHSALVDALASKKLNPIISLELPIEEAAEAHRLVLESGKYGKIVLLV